MTPFQSFAFAPGDRVFAKTHYARGTIRQRSISEHEGGRLSRMYRVTLPAIATSIYTPREETVWLPADEVVSIVEGNRLMDELCAEYQAEKRARELAGRVA